MKYEALLHTAHHQNDIYEHNEHNWSVDHFILAFHRNDFGSLPSIEYA